jgi:hypothetical protein
MSSTAEVLTEIEQRSVRDAHNDLSMGPCTATVCGSRYCQAARDRLALLGVVRAALALADEWADQPTDYDEDTERQIEDGKELRSALAALTYLAGQ